MPQQELPKVAPFDACISCFRGDTKTRLAFRGSFTGHVAFLEYIGLPEDHAMSSANRAYDREEVADGEVPITCVYVVCEECANPAGRAGVPIELPGPNGELHVRWLPSDSETWREH